MEEGVVRSRFGHFRSFLEVCVVVFVTHVVPFFDKSHFLIPVAWQKTRLYFFFIVSKNQPLFVRRLSVFGGGFGASKN